MTRCLWIRQSGCKHCFLNCLSLWKRKNWEEISVGNGREPIPVYIPKHIYLYIPLVRGREDHHRKTDGKSEGSHVPVWEYTPTASDHINSVAVNKMVASYYNDFPVDRSCKSKLSSAEKKIKDLLCQCRCCFERSSKQGSGNFHISTRHSQLLANRTTAWFHCALTYCSTDWGRAEGQVTASVTGLGHGPQLFRIMLK